MSNVKSSKSKSIVGVFLVRLLRPVFSIITLSALVLGISLFVKEVSTTSTHKVASAVSPVLKKINIDVDENALGSVAGAFISRVSPEIDTEKKPSPVVSNAKPLENKSSVLSLALVADIHGEFDKLKLGLEMSQKNNISTVLVLGDITQLGIKEDLLSAKNILDASGLEYFSIPGDHDLWKSVGPQNYVEVFGTNYHTFVKQSSTFVMLDNSANFTLISPEIMNRFYADLKTADFIILAQPIYHPVNQRVMGIVDGEEDASVHAQALEILSNIRKSNVKAIISADHHFSSQSVDPINTNLKHVVIGALAGERNLQSPRFAILSLFDDGSFEIKDVAL